jgi:thymidylate synthase (FAD)
MELIKPSVQYLGQPPADPVAALRFIELAGRTCYKSEDKISDTSADKFVRGIVKSGHHSVIEHSNLVMLNQGPNNDMDDLVKQYKEICAGFGERMAYHKIEIHDGLVWVAGNYRAWLQTIEYLLGSDYTVDIAYLCPTAAEIVALDAMRILAPFFQDIYTYDDTHEEFLEQWAYEYRFQRAYDTDGCEIPLRLQQHTARIICDRGVTHEIVRHRPFAYSQESTRYVNYKGGMQFIIPNWTTIEEKGENQSLQFKNMSTQEYAWARACLDAELTYQNLIEQGWKPQQARSVLPNSLKTEIVCTAFTEAWEWLFHMRVGKAAHPQIREVMIPLEEIMSEAWGVAGSHKHY